MVLPPSILALKHARISMWRNTPFPPQNCKPVALNPIWDFPKIRVPYFGVLIIRILLFRVLYKGPLCSGINPDPWHGPPRQ